MDYICYNIINQMLALSGTCPQTRTNYLRKHDVKQKQCILYKSIDLFTPEAQMFVFVFFTVNKCL